jgi:hypothetical protein
MSMVREAAIAGIRSRSPQPSRSPIPLYAQPGSAPDPMRPFSGPQMDREKVDVVTERNVAFDIPEPGIKRVRRAMPCFKGTTAVSGSKPPTTRNPRTFSLRREASYAEKVEAAALNQRIEVTGEARVLAGRSQTTPPKQHRTANAASSSSASASRYKGSSSYAFSSYSHGESERGHIPSAFPRTRQPRDSDFKYTVVRKDRDKLSSEIFHMVEPEHQSATRNMFAKPIQALYHKGRMTCVW